MDATAGHRRADRIAFAASRLGSLLFLDKSD
jgi:hypothetical protein